MKACSMNCKIKQRRQLRNYVVFSTDAGGAPCLVVFETWGNAYSGRLHQYLCNLQILVKPSKLHNFP